MILEILRGVADKLKGSASVTAVVGDRIFLMQAPAAADSPIPAVLVSLSGATSDNETPVDSVNVRYSIIGMSYDAIEAMTLADAIRSALHEQAVTAGAGWDIYRSQHENEVQYVENIERRQIYYAGGVYRIRANQQ